VGERIEWFLIDAPQPVLSRRNLDEPGAASSQIDAVVDRIARSVEFIVDHQGDLLPPRDRQPIARPRSNSEVERMARVARDQLDLDDHQPLLDLSDRLAEIGLLTFSVDLGPDTADGASIALRDGGVSVINGNRMVGRRRLTATHELGHFLVGDEYTTDWRVGDGDASSWEARLDRFARAVLLPASGLEDAWRERGASGENLRTCAVRIASRFRVDMSTLALRLRELRIVSSAEADQVRHVRTTRADIVEHELLIKDELAAPSLPRRYEAAVLGLYRSEIVSAARATDLLLDSWEESDLPELPTLPENSIWKFVS
jgi:Zn-dependent peptidase ImmA (M78 family)